MGMSLKSSFIHHLEIKYPDISSAVFDGLVAEELISPFQVTLSSETLKSIQQQIQHYWSLRDWGSHNLAEKYAALDLRKPNNYSACMSYDFHLNANKELELIEINTNAAFLALGLELYDFHKIKNAVPFGEKNLLEMFLNELQLCGYAANEDIGIVDLKPPEQRLYLEFLIYQQMFKKHGVAAKILDVQEVTGAPHFLYNRYTDFYLQDEISKNLRSLFNSCQINLSPHPWDYFLLADKQRLIDWNLQSNFEKPSSLLPVYDLAHADKEEIWKNRKNLFFKPKNSFGSKQAYRGASISKATFETVFADNFIAQKMSNPAEIEETFIGNRIKYKFDLRCYAYQDKLQMIIARLYQGQTTNLRTAGGGFACVIID